jgi:hypothetical protein
MAPWFRRIRGTLGMGIVWALGWAVIGGGIMEGVVDPDGRILDMWPQTLAITGFLSGVVFGALLGALDGRRRFDELSLSRFVGLGATAGLLVSAFALVTGAGHNLASLPLRIVVITGPAVALSVICASATLLLARLAGRGARAIESDADRRAAAPRGEAALPHAVAYDERALAQRSREAQPVRGGESGIT